MLPGLFRNPINGDAIAYAQVRLFIPQRRLVWHWSSPTPDRRMGGVPGEFPELPDEEEEQDAEPAEGRWVVAASLCAGRVGSVEPALDRPIGARHRARLGSRAPDGPVAP